MRCRVARATPALPRNARETAAGDTPAAAATSSSVTLRGPGLSVVLIVRLPLRLRVARRSFSEELLEDQSNLALLDKAAGQETAIELKNGELSLAGTAPDDSPSRP